MKKILSQFIPILCVITVFLTFSITGNAQILYPKMTDDATVSTSSSDIQVNFKQNTSVFNPAIYEYAPNDTGVVLYNNGPYFNQIFPYLSIIDSPNTTNGWNNNKAFYSIADDFVLTGDADITSMVFYLYQVGATTPSIDEIYIRIWNDAPNTPGSAIVWGNQTTNVFASAENTSTYRVAPTSQSNTDRKIQKVTANTTGLSLNAGTYWVEFTSAGTVASGPWAPPIALTGGVATGDALLYNISSGTWSNLIDGGSGFLHGIPFQVIGTMNYNSGPCDEVILGEGGTETSTYIPICYYYNYSFSQAIYTAAELQAMGAVAGNIKKIAYLPGASVSTQNWRNWTIYMKNTTKSSFSGGTDWMPVTGSMQQVFDGNIPNNITDGEWMEIDLDIYFPWDGTSNIVIAVVDKGAGNSSSTPSWEAYAAGTGRGIYIYDDFPINVDSPVRVGNYSGIKSNLPQIKFCGNIYPACSTVSAGVISGLSIECPNTPFTLTAVGASNHLSGLVSQWQSSANGTSWSDIPGETHPTLTTTITSPTYFRYTVECANGSISNTTAAHFVNLNTNANECYCVPVGANSYYYIKDFSTTGGTTANISNLDSGLSPGGYGNFFHTHTVSREIGGTVNFDAKYGGSNAFGFRIWVDWNQDGFFDPDTELAYNSTAYSNAHTGSFTVPATAMSGVTRMRIVNRYFTSNGTLDPCATNHTDGEFEDYKFIVLGNHLISTSSSPAAGGTTSGGGTYSWGSTVTVHATPATGYEFKNWQEGGVVVSTNPNYTFTVTANRALVAKFKTSSGGASYTITTKSSPTAGGTTTGAGTYSSGSSVTVKATPAAGYVFESWKEGSTVVATTKKYIFTATANRTLKAVFKPQTTSYTITTKSSPTAGGTTTGDGTYASGSSATVTAIPAAGYDFESWLEGATVVSTNPSYTFTVSGKRTLNAKFKVATVNYTITTKVNSAAGGTTTGGGSYASGSLATVKASPAAGYVFTSWKEGGVIVATTKKYSFTVTGNRTLKAFFAAQSRINATANFAEAGEITGAGEYAVEGMVNLVATVNPGYTFTGWMENGKLVWTEPEYNFSADGDRNLTAFYERNSKPENTDSNYQIYPNPFDDFIMLDAAGQKILKAELYDMSGRLVYTQSINQETACRLDTKQILKGNYLLMIYTAKGTKSIKMLKK